MGSSDNAWPLGRIHFGSEFQDPVLAYIFSGSVGLALLSGCVVAGRMVVLPTGAWDIYRYCLLTTVAAVLAYTAECFEVIGDSIGTERGFLSDHDMKPRSSFIELLLATVSPHFIFDLVGSCMMLKAVSYIAGVPQKQTNIGLLCVAMFQLSIASSHGFRIWGSAVLTLCGIVYATLFFTLLVYYIFHTLRQHVEDFAPHRIRDTVSAAGVVFATLVIFEMVVNIAVLLGLEFSAQTYLSLRSINDFILVGCFPQMLTNDPELAMELYRRDMRIDDFGYYVGIHADMTTQQSEIDVCESARVQLFSAASLPGPELEQLGSEESMRVQNDWKSEQIGMAWDDYLTHSPRSPKWPTARTGLVPNPNLMGMQNHELKNV